MPNRPLRLTFLNCHQRHAGAERCLNDLVRGMRRRGHEVAMVVARPEEGAAPVEVQSPHFLEWVWQRGWHRLIGVTDTLLLSPLWRAWRQPVFRQADIIHIHNLHGGYFNFWALPILARHCPLVMTLHDMFLLTGDCIYSGPCERWQNKCGACPVLRRPSAQRGALGGGDLTRLNLAIKRAACSWIPPRRLALAPPSRWLGRLTAQAHLREFPIHIIPYGVDLGLFAPADQILTRQRLELPRDRVLLAAVAGNWDNPFKGGDLLLEAARLLQQHATAQIIVAGRMSADTRHKLQTYGAIVLEGLHGSEVVRDVFAACDAALVLSKEENLPYVVMEALACGCPVMARGSGGIPEMFMDGRHGWLLSTQATAADILHRVRQLQIESLEVRQQRRRAARRHAEQCYGIDTMLDAYESLYANLLTGKHEIHRHGNQAA